MPYRNPGSRTCRCTSEVSDLLWQIRQRRLTRTGLALMTFCCHRSCLLLRSFNTAVQWGLCTGTAGCAPPLALTDISLTSNSFRTVQHINAPANHSNIEHRIQTPVTESGASPSPKQGPGRKYLVKRAVPSQTSVRDHANKPIENCEGLQRWRAKKTASFQRVPKFVKTLRPRLAPYKKCT